MLTARAHYLVYAVAGRAEGELLHVTSLAPVVLLEAEALDAHFRGAWEGVMNPRVGPQLWRTEPPVDDVKVRVVFDRFEPSDPLRDDGQASAIPRDGRRFRVVGTIENASAPVRLASGTCAPSLASLGTRNPILGATQPELRLRRHPMMHSPSDNVIEMDYPPGLYMNGTMMTGAGGYFLEDFIALAVDRTAPHRFLIHGHLPGQLYVELAPVTGGGGTCTP